MKSIMHEVEEHVRYMTLGGLDFESKREGYFLMIYVIVAGPPLWSSGQSFWLQIQRSRVRFPALPAFLSSSLS